jgi:hypothetical protein
VTFELEPVTGEGISINGWNWRPTLELLDRTGVLSEETLDLMSYNGGGGQATTEQAERIAEFLDGYLADLHPGDRVTLDGRVIAEPDYDRLDRDHPDRNYAATYAWLARFRDFCRSSGGFTVY